MTQDRWPEAEKDCLKQIEVAPSQAYSFEKLGERRMMMGRFRQAVELLRQGRPGRPEAGPEVAGPGRRPGRRRPAHEARVSLDKAMSLEPEDWMWVVAARHYFALET